MGESNAGMRFRHVRFPARARAPFYLIAGAGIAAVTLRSISDPNPFLDTLSTADRIRLEAEGVIRSSRAIYAITFVVIDYKFSLWGLEHRSEEYQNKLKEIHLRSAQRILKLCETNKGFYIKAGQFFSSLRQIPKEYSSTLSKLQDKASPPFKDIKEVIARNFKKDFSELFYSFDEKPLAAASIAQVHRACLRDGQEVAVKVQYSGLQQRLAVDIRTMTILAYLIAQVFPEYRFQWMLPEFKRALTLELDFVQEGKNAERITRNLARKKMIKVPCIFWELTTEQVLTMEFFHGKKVDDVEYLKDQRINPEKVASVIVELFSEMIFIDGFVHGDPHPGNLLVSPDPHHGFDLVVLDHGIYRELDEQFRIDYCQLWKALILMDSKTILKIGEKFGLRDYAKFFPVIFTGRTLNGKSALGDQLSAEEKKKLQRELSRLKMGDISSFMESMPPEFLTILRTDAQVRSMMGRLGALTHVRLITYGRYAARGLCNWRRESGHLLEQISTVVSCLQLWIYLEVMDLLWRLKGWNRLLLAKIRGLNHPMAYFTSLIS